MTAFGALGFKVLNGAFCAVSHHIGDSSLKTGCHISDVLLQQFTGRQRIHSAADGGFQTGKGKMTTGLAAHRAG